MSLHSHYPERDGSLTVEEIRRLRAPRRTPGGGHATHDNPGEHPLVREFKRDMAALRRQWDLEDEEKWTQATRSFATRVARR